MDLCMLRTFALACAHVGLLALLRARVCWVGLVRTRVGWATLFTLTGPLIQWLLASISVLASVLTLFA